MINSKQTAYLVDKRRVQSEAFVVSAAAAAVLLTNQDQQVLLLHMTTCSQMRSVAVADRCRQDAANNAAAIEVKLNK